METQELKCVMVVDENLPLGIITNTAAVMGITLGKLFPHTVGDDVYDKTGSVPESGLNYFGVAICGSKKQVNKLTGSMPLLR